MTYSTNFSIDDLRFDNYGLIPAIAQDWLDGSILMLAWMNKESLTMTLEPKTFIIGVDQDPKFGEKELQVEVPKYLRR